MKNHFRTIVLSDIHLGTSGSKAKEVSHFLKHNSCDRLILNGDIIDGWQLKKYGKWKKTHTKFFKRVLQLIENHNTEVIYLRGNHDDFLDQVIPMAIGNFRLQRDYVLDGADGKRYYVVHGDIFDNVTTNLKWIAKLGDIGYTFLLWLNKHYNNYRVRKGKPYYSLSQAIKAKVKSAVSYISDYEEQLAILARLKNCDGIICGHIHQPAIKTIGNLEYMNSGDWVESLSALVENELGEWRLEYFTETLIAEHTQDDEEEPVPDFMQEVISLKKEIKVIKRLEVKAS